MKHLNDSKAFIEFSDNVYDVYEDIDDYNSTRKRKIFTVFNDMITGIMSNNRLQAVAK